MSAALPPKPGCLGSRAFSMSSDSCSCNYGLFPWLGNVTPVLLVIAWTNLFVFCRQFWCSKIRLQGNQIGLGPAIGYLYSCSSFFYCKRLFFSKATCYIYYYLDSYCVRCTHIRLRLGWNRLTQHQYYPLQRHCRYLQSWLSREFQHDVFILHR